MLHAVTNYVHERRHGLARAAGYVGGAYLMGRYVVERLEDVRMRVVQDRLARDNLRRRFEQNQQDVAFTIMALLPTLGAHILEGMDVEGVSHELQSLLKTPRAPLELPSPAPVAESSRASSVELSRAEEQDVRSENGSVSVISSVYVDGSPSNLNASSSSWVDQFSTMHSSQVSQVPLENMSGVSERIPHPRPDSPRSNVGTDLSDSMTSTSSVSSAVPGEPTISTPESTISDMTSSVTKNKAELWKEVKILTFTRTLTIIYSMTLLSLFTHIQLNLLGRSKYIQSIIQLEQDERMREQLQYNASVYAMFWGDSSLEEAEPELEEAISEETERKCLTLSWWILHVGWKDVGERVRRAVEDVFEGISLKTKFTVGDLHRLISDVRRRVEYEVTFEGKERRIDFLSALLPPTPETLQHVLTQGGIAVRSASAPDAVFHALLDETRTHICSASFERVLEVCLDHATEVLLSGVQRHVFGGDESADARERLAAMLPGLARWCHLALEGLPNELLDGLADLRETAALSAIIYSSYEDRFR